MKFYLYSNKDNEVFHNKLIYCDYKKKTFAIYTKTKKEKHPDIWEEITGTVNKSPVIWKEIDLKTVVRLLEYEKLYATKPKRNAKVHKRVTRVKRSANK